jgi:hypothetical protein
VVAAVTARAAGEAGVPRRDRRRCTDGRRHRRRYLGHHPRHPGLIDDAIGGVAEGAFTVAAACVLADRHGVAAPIVREIHLAIDERRPVRRCLADLLAREERDEQADVEAWRTALSGR